MHFISSLANEIMAPAYIIREISRTVSRNSNDKECSICRKEVLNQSKLKALTFSIPTQRFWRRIQVSNGGKRRGTTLSESL